MDWSGRAIRNDKRGYIPSKLPPILVRLNISPDRWLLNSQHFEKIVSCKNPVVFSFLCFLNKLFQNFSTNF